MPASAVFASAMDLMRAERLFLMLALATAVAGCRGVVAPTTHAGTRPWLTPAEHVASRQIATASSPSLAMPDPPSAGAPEAVMVDHVEPLESTEREVPREAIPPPAAPLTLDLFQALETSLVQNPDLATLRQNEGVSLGALGVAQTFPFNPFLQLQVTPLQDSKTGGPGTVYHYVLLMQTIQLGHQQRRREENAWAALQSVRWNIVQAELQNVAQTERLYFTALYQRGLRDLAAANGALNDELLKIIERRLEAGDAAAADVAVARLDNRTAHRQSALAEANYQTALLDLRRQLALPMHLPLEPTGDLNDWQWLDPAAGEAASDTADNARAATDARIDFSEAAAAMTAMRPDVMAARADLAAARANAGLARGSRIPDLQIGPYYQRTESGTTYWGLRTQNDLPVWNDGRPLVRQREAEIRQRAVAWQQLQRRAQLEAEAALDRYCRARALAASIEADGLESLPEELARLENQFRAGEVDFLRVVTARTSLLQLRRARLDALNEAAQAAAALTAATALPPETVVRLKAESIAETIP